MTFFGLSKLSDMTLFWKNPAGSTSIANYVGTLIGFNRSADLIEVLYNDIDEDTVRVFHAMECRNSFKALLKL
jgi:hypothetical protein